jgi:hypothetical protein
MAKKKKAAPRKITINLSKGFKMPKGVALQLRVEEDGKMHIMGCRGVGSPTPPVTPAIPKKTK